MIRIKYKWDQRTTKEKCPTVNTDTFIKLLFANKENLYSGIAGVYLSRKVIFEGQELFFPFLDVDAEDKMIESAIGNAALTYHLLKKMGADRHFKIIATGGHGFRFVSNLLINKTAYQGFIQLIRYEMPHIIDLKPTIDVEMPHQLFTYKGNITHSKNLVDRHAVILPLDMFERPIFTVNDYKRITEGRLDPDTIIASMESFFKFRPVADLKSLGKFGEHLLEYQNIAGQIKVNSFNYIQSLKDRNRNSLSLEVVHKMLNEKGIPCVIAKRGRPAISFQGKGLKCPVCGKESGNAVASPPIYKLYCFRTPCPANRDKGGVPFHKWSGISGLDDSQNKKVATPIIELPSKFVSKIEVRKIISAALQTQDDNLILMTPGIGKSWEAVDHIANNMKRKVVIYSCFNKALQEEAYKNFIKLCPDKNRACLIQSREVLCKKTTELKMITGSGFSPAEVLCPKCEYRNNDCPYYEQFKPNNHEVFFVTHHMLQYLEKRIENPDLIILDENLKSGFLLEDGCDEEQMLSIRRVVPKKDFQLCITLLDIGHNIGREIMLKNGYPIILNAKKMTGVNDFEDTIIGILAKQLDWSEKKVIKRIRRIITKIKRHSNTKLYNKAVSLSAVNWIKELVRNNGFPYLLITAKNQLKFNFKQITPFGFKNTPIKILDATGNERVANALLNRKIKTIKADVDWQSNRTHIIYSISRKIKKSENDAIKSLIEKMLPETSAEKILVYTYKFLQEKVIKACKQIDPSREYMGYYFSGPRGINDFKDCDAVLVIGQPYSNVNNAGHDAYSIFPSKKDEDIRDSWVELEMEWELIQGIHRIRPVNKKSVDIIIAAKRWPTLLPKPDKQIDHSQNESWKEAAISTLEPFVREFGFLNPDIGYIANVFIKKKKEVAIKFQKKIDQIQQAIFQFSPLNLGEGDKWGKGKNYFHFGVNTSSPAEIEKRKLFLVLYNIYIQKSLKHDGNLHEKISNCYVKEKGKSKSEVILSPIILSTQTQWTQLLNHFKKKYPHFEEFKIKLPHARGNAVTGVGCKSQVIDFYNELNSYKIFGKIDLGSYETKEDAEKLIEPIPRKFIVVYIADESDEYFYLAAGDQYQRVSLKSNIQRTEDFLYRIALGGTKIITNNGKAFARKVLELNISGLDKLNVIDVVLNEKIIRNGEVDLKLINEDRIFRQYGLIEQPDFILMLSQLNEVRRQQKRIILKSGLKSTIKLESKLIWVTAKIEMTGIEVNVDAMLKYQDLVQSRLDDLNNELRVMIPDTISLNDHAALKAFLKKRFRLEVVKLKDLKKIPFNDPRLKSMSDNLLEYQDLYRQNGAIERYIGFVGPDDRARDQIEQLGTKTGRFYKELQTVPRSGPMRSFFIAAPGYKLIKADYAQQEIRILAGLSGDAALLAIFKSEKDVYMEIAKKIFGDSSIPVTDQRKIAKVIVVGINNGMSHYTVHEEITQSGLNFTLLEVEHFYNQFILTFSIAFKYLERAVREGRANGCVAAASGRRMTVDADIKDNSIRNFPIQGAGSDGFKNALLDLNFELKDLDARIVHILHDEIIVEAEESITDEVADKVNRCMEHAYKSYFSNVPMMVELEVVDAWGK